MPKNILHETNPVFSENNLSESPSDTLRAEEDAEGNDNCNSNEIKEAEEQNTGTQQSSQNDYDDPYQGEVPAPYNYNGQPVPVQKGNTAAVTGFVFGIVGIVFAGLTWTLPLLLYSDPGRNYGGPLVLTASDVVAFLCGINSVAAGIVGTILSIIGITKPGKKTLAIIGLMMSMAVVGAAAVFLIVIVVVMIGYFH